MPPRRLPPKRTSVTSRTDLPPPNSPEAEASVLACCLLDPFNCVGKCIAELKAGGEEFDDLRNRTIFEVLREMFDDNEPVEVGTLYQRLKDKDVHEQVGGLPFLMSLPDQASSAAALPTYLETVKNKHLLRKMLEACSVTAQKIYECNGKVTEVLDEAERVVLEVRSLRATPQELEPKELVRSAIGAIEAMHQRQGLCDGLATGFNDLDKMTGGFHAGEMIVLACLPGIGKTSLAMNIAEHVLLELHKPVGIFSLEMSAVSLVTRFLCSRARVSLRNIRDGFLAERDFPKLTGAAGKFANAKMRFDDETDLTAYQFRAKARRMRQEHKVEMIVVDYLQLMSGGGGSKDNNRQEEVAQISRVVKMTARELGVPIIAMSQLNDDGRLRESRAIGQDADFVGVLEPVDDEENNHDGEAVAYTLKIKKQRNGPTGPVHLTFLKAYTRFESAAKVSDSDYNPPPQ